MSTETLDYNRGLDRVDRPQSIANFIQNGVNILFVWHSRQKGRIQLSELDDHLLEDIGMTQDQRQHEIEKPFWVK